MTYVCKDKCRIDPPKRDGWQGAVIRIDEGILWCECCAKLIKTDNIPWCPCCNSRCRVKARTRRKNLVYVRI